MNGAQAMVKCLEKEGVEMIFGYPGVAICPFYDSVLDSGIRPILIRTEQNAAHAASGMARVTKKVGVCAVTSGPGATNLITGIATAFADSIPLVCITGQVNSELIGSDVLPDDQKLVIETARVIRVGFLQQNAFHADDTFVPLEKQKRMMQVILHLYHKAHQLVAAAVPISSILETGLFDKLVKMKYDIPNDKLEMFDEYTAEIDQKIGELLRA